MKTPARLSMPSLVLLIVALWFSASTLSMAETIKGMEVKPFLGHVVKLNEKRGRIEIMTEKKVTRRWLVGKFTTVYQGKKRRDLKATAESRRVRAYVTKKGKVLRIDLLDATAK